MAVKVVTDSTADLPLQLARELGIVVVPLNVHFGDETFKDGVDLDADEFYRRLIASPRLPTTSQPSPGAFVEVYRPLLEAGHEVVSIHISSKLSGTVNAALQARGQLEGAPLEVVDSLQASLGIGLVAVAAARAAQGGASYEDTLLSARNAAEQVQVVCLLDTLEYLERGGRIGKVQAWMGTLLRIRPVITVREGIVHPLTRVRSRAQGIQQMVTLAERHAPLQQAAVLHSTMPEEANAMAEQIRPLLPGGTVIAGRFGPVLGTYVGPGALGIAFQAGAQ